MAASLSAPKGPTEQEIVVEATQSALLSAIDIDAVECHASGAYLADAVEISSMLRSHRSLQQNEPITMMAHKTVCGNMVWPAGLAAFVKVLGNQRRNIMNPLCHISVINPHIEMEESSALVPTEAMSFRTSMGSYVGTMSRGFGGTNVYAISLGAPRDEGAAPKLEVHENMLSFWPGGGGALESGSIPSTGYWIAGSFNDWQPQAMTGTGSGSYKFTVSLPDGGVAEFQIWLDGDSSRSLFPEWPQAPSSTRVLGPSPSQHVGGYSWLICGEDMQPGVAGDKYCVVLQVAGKWQSVSWVKV
jgi:hypothetical protein